MWIGTCWERTGLVDGLWGDAWLLSGDTLGEGWLMAGDSLGEGWLLGGDFLAGEFCSKLFLGEGNSKFIYFNGAMYFNIISSTIFFKVLFLEFIVFVVLAKFFFVDGISKLISVTLNFVFSSNNQQRFQRTLFISYLLPVNVFCWGWLDLREVGSCVASPPVLCHPLSRRKLCHLHKNQGWWCRRKLRKECQSWRKEF